MDRLGDGINDVEDILRKGTGISGGLVVLDRSGRRFMDLDHVVVIFFVSTGRNADRNGDSTEEGQKEEISKGE